MDNTLNNHIIKVYIWIFLKKISILIKTNKNKFETCIANKHNISNYFRLITSSLTFLKQQSTSHQPIKKTTTIKAQQIGIYDQFITINNPKQSKQGK